MLLAALAAADASPARAETRLAEVVVPADDTVPPDRLEIFAEFLIRDMNEFWRREFRRQKYRGWRDAKLVTFERSIKTPCGRRLAKMGIMYCTRNQTIYLPRLALMEFREEMGVPGDFAQALAVAHEMGHHAQLGLHLTKRTARRHRLANNKTQKRRIKIRHELQADCFAGVWAHSVKKRDLLEDGDIGEALAAARAMGDDTLGVPRHRWKHGAARERARSFKSGFRSGKVARCRGVGRETTAKKGEMQ